MKKREAYVRVTLCATENLEVLVGVEIGEGEDPSILYAEVRAAVWPVDIVDKNDMQIGKTVEEMIRFHYPGRSYFLEVGRGAGDEYVQIFQP
jgi:hypothetical protein